MHFEPGTEGRYSNTNYFLLGHILEMLTGKPLSAAMSDVFMRFGLNHTHMNGHIADACGYVRRYFLAADLPWRAAIAALFLR